jgi:ATP adenylyltransferase/5',5'''-P-1,P-4-tetraphosphate phosphorylase II
LKTILKEIDPFAFEEALRMNAAQKKQYAVKQDEDDRKNLDKKWDRLNTKLRQQDSHFQEPEYPYKQSALIRDFNELYLKIYDKEKFMNL